MASPRAAEPFMAINCAALPETLLEAELFGYEKGSFTGAVEARAGLLEATEGGTLFLDEVGELPLGTQAKLLRVLDERAVLRVGSRKPRSVGARFLAATNRDLQEATRQGTFRKDLYFRLNGIALTIPPLRERAEEVGDLARLFAARAAEGLHRAAPLVSDEVLRILIAHDWPGNVRELRNLMERAVVLCTGNQITEEHLPPELLAAPAAGATVNANEPLRDQIDALEKERILAALTACGGNQSRAADQLGMSRRTLVTRLGAWGLTRPRKRS
jgi:transcriptional regulator with PAS, ATPase and Fis domain